MGAPAPCTASLSAGLISYMAVVSTATCTSYYSTGTELLTCIYAYVLLHYYYC